MAVEWEISLGLLPRPLPVNRTIFTGARERDNQQLLLANTARDFLTCCLIQLGGWSLRDVSVMQDEGGRIRFTHFAGLH